MTTYIVTGAAGFIGSNLVAALNAARRAQHHRGRQPAARADKFRNLVDCEIADYLDKREFLERIGAGEFDGAVDAVLHQGACSDTMETDGRYMMENNYRYSLRAARLVPGRGDPVHLRLVGGGVRRRARCSARSASYESPLNVYGYSKFLFDQVVRRRMRDARRAGRGLPLLQRLRPERGAQGAHGLGRVPLLQPVPRRAAR